MARLTTVAAAGAALLMGVACGGSSTAAGPAYPNVAGTYSGTLTVGTLAGSFTCPASTVVTQSGASVTIGMLTLSAPCPSHGISAVPLGQVNATIDANGTLGNVTNAILTVPSCGGTYSVNGGAYFSGSSLNVASAYMPVSDTCARFPGPFMLNGMLTR